ncbi:MAG TPA: galactokinase [Micromonosporaceae bacterium]|nr:galactokinase [Micromonosporaceae bacterium]
MSVAVRAAAAFSREYGGQPAGCWAAPGRVNLIGEHTDYNAGFVLPFALPLRTAVAASPVDSLEWTVWSEQEGAAVSFGAADLVPGRVKGWAAYPAGVVWALREAGFAVPGARLAIASDVPAGAGLSSSAALECAVLTALADLGGLDLPEVRRPGLAQRAENAYVGVPCGIMDQSAAVLCRAGHALFLDCRTLATEQVPLDLAGLAILVIDTRAPHQLVTGEYAARRAACEQAARDLGVAALRDVPPDGLDEALPRLASEVICRRVRHVVTENQRVLSTVALLRAGRVREIGPLLFASHASLRDDFEVSVPELDTAVEAALSAGAYGARMTGGGFGGCVLALVDAAAVEPVSDAVRKAFAARAFSPPVAFVAPPSASTGPVTGY